MNLLFVSAMVMLAFALGIMLGAALAFMYIGRVTDEEVAQVLE